MLKIEMNKNEKQKIYRNSPYFRHYLSFGKDLLESNSKYSAQIEIENMILNYESLDEVTEKAYNYFKRPLPKKILKGVQEFFLPTSSTDSMKVSQLKGAINLYIKYPNILPFQNNEYLISDKSYDDSKTYKLELAPFYKKKNIRVPKEVSLYINNNFSRKFNPMEIVQIELKGGFHILTFKGSKKDYFTIDLFINKDLVCYTSFDFLLPNFINFFN